MAVGTMGARIRRCDRLRRHGWSKRRRAASEFGVRGRSGLSFTVSYEFACNYNFVTVLYYCIGPI